MLEEKDRIDLACDQLPIPEPKEKYNQQVLLQLRVFFNFIKSSVQFQSI